ncbi:MAG: hypothetical protein M3275_16380 [Thermoproteota archaeon]|nr:hypothetical protein [Thermoproteota archaeon]
MEYLNDRTYKRGEEVTVKVTVKAETVTKGGNVAYEGTVADLTSQDGYKLRLWGEAPEVADEEATIILTGTVEDVGDGIYRNSGGVLGRVPGDTVRFHELCRLDRPLKVEGEVENRESR